MKITDELQDLFYEYINKTGMSPNAILLGEIEYEEFKEECRFIFYKELVNISSFHGATIIKTKNKNELKIGYIL